MTAKTPRKSERVVIFYSPRSVPRVEVVILQASKQIHHEASTVIYGENVFYCLPFRPTYGRRSTSPISAPFPDANIEKLQYVQLEFEQDRDEINSEGIALEKGFLSEMVRSLSLFQSRVRKEKQGSDSRYRPRHTDFSSTRRASVSQEIQITVLDNLVKTGAAFRGFVHSALRKTDWDCTEQEIVEKEEDDDEVIWYTWIWSLQPAHNRTAHDVRPSSLEYEAENCTLNTCIITLVLSHTPTHEYQWFFAHRR